MGLFSRGKKRGARRPDGGAELAEVRAWLADRRGVEVFVEPMTPVTPTTVVLVDGTGAFTRRVVASPQAAERLARAHGLPVYDVTLVGYPQRMRDELARQRIRRQRDARAALGE